MTPTMATMRWRLERGDRVALLVLVAAMALAAFYAGPAYALPRLFWIAALLVAAGVAAIAVLLARRTPGSRRAVLATAAYGAVLVLGVATSESPESSLPPLFALLATPLAACIVLAVRRPAALFVLATLVVLFALGNAGFAIAELARTRLRAEGFVSDPTLLAMLLLFGWFVATTLWMSGFARRPVSIVLLVALVVIAAAIGATLSRSATLAWLACAGALAGFAAVRRVKLPIILLPLVLSAAAAGLIATQVSTKAYRMVDGQVLQQGAAPRLLLWGAAAAMWREHPVLGGGLQTFRQRYPAWRLPAEYGTGANFVHNEYLQFLSDGGIPLLAALLLVVAASGGRILRLLPGVRPAHEERAAGGQPPDPLAWLALAAGLQVVAMMAIAWLYFAFYVVPLALLLGIALGLLFWQPPPGPMAPVRLPAGERIALGLAGLVLVALLWRLLLDGMIAAIASDQPGMPFARAVRGDATALVPALERLRALSPDRGLPSLALARIARNQARDARSDAVRVDQAHRAFDLYRESIERDPWNPYALLAMTNLLREQPDLLADAERTRAMALLFRGAQRLDPSLLGAHVLEARWHLERGDDPAALTALLRGLRWARTHVLTDPDELISALVEARRLALALGDTDGLGAVEVAALELAPDQVPVWRAAIAAGDGG